MNSESVFITAQGPHVRSKLEVTLISCTKMDRSFCSIQGKEGQRRRGREGVKREGGRESGGLRHTKE